MLGIVFVEHHVLTPPGKVWALGVGIILMIVGIDTRRHLKRIRTEIGP